MLSFKRYSFICSFQRAKLAIFLVPGVVNGMRTLGSVFYPSLGMRISAPTRVYVEVYIEHTSLSQHDMSLFFVLDKERLVLDVEFFFGGRFLG